MPVTWPVKGSVTDDGFKGSSYAKSHFCNSLSENMRQNGASCSLYDPTTESSKGNDSVEPSKVLSCAPMLRPMTVAAKALLVEM